MIAVLGSCGSPTTPGNPAPSPDATAEVSCGDVVLEQGEQLALAAATELACLERALKESLSAALTVTGPTVEGDPIVTSWQLTSDGTLSADIDSSKDRFGSEDHTHVSCGQVTELPDMMTCEAKQ